MNLLTTNIPHHIETCQLIFRANQLTGFYMIGHIGRKWIVLRLGTHFKDCIKVKKAYHKYEKQC